MIDEFLLRAGLGGVGVALAAGPLGCFVIWRRMAYFGDATAHAALLGVALSFALSMPVFPGVLLAAFATISATWQQAVESEFNSGINFLFIVQPQIEAQTLAANFPFSFRIVYM